MSNQARLYLKYIHNKATKFLFAASLLCVSSYIMDRAQTNQQNYLHDAMLSRLNKQAPCVKFSSTYNKLLSNGYGSKDFSKNYEATLDRLQLQENRNERNFSGNFKPVFVTGISSNHYLEAVALIESIANAWPGHVLYVYDLGLHSTQVTMLKKVTFVRYRKFTFNQYPLYVTFLRQYRFKPLIITDVLRLHDLVWWCDASTRFNCSQKFDMSSNDVTMLLFDGTPHSIYGATHPIMFDYFPLNIHCAKSISMFGANVILVLKTPLLRRAILRPWVQCALEEQCMAPRGATAECKTPTNQDKRINAHFMCHRFDQSALNIVLAHLYNFNVSRYHTSANRCITVHRRKVYMNDSVLLGFFHPPHKSHDGLVGSTSLEETVRTYYP